MDINKLNHLSYSFSNLFFESLDIASQLEILDEPEPIVIPDIYNLSRDVCTSIYKDIQAFFEHDDEETSVEVIQKTIGRFCLCAGMGAVELWSANNDSFKQKGLYTLLTKERGLYEMDEFVYDLVGLQMGSIKCKEFISKSFLLFDLILKKSYDLMNEQFLDFKDSPQRYISLMLMEVYRIMFKIGVTMQARNIYKPCISKNNKKRVNTNSESIKYIYQNMKELVNKSIRPDFLSGYTPTLVNSLFAAFTELHLKSGYVYDVYEYQDELPMSGKYHSMLGSSIEKHIYVRQNNSPKKYSPTLDQSFVDELYNNYPNMYQLINTDFTDDMKIDDTLYTQDSIKNIPDPLTYIQCEFNEKSAWEYFLFDTFVSQKIWPMLFSYEQFKTEFSDYYDKDFYAHIKKEDDGRLCEMNLFPKVEIIDSKALITCYQVRIGAIVKLQEIIEFKDSSYRIIKCDEDAIISFKFREHGHVSFKRYPYWY